MRGEPSPWIDDLDDDDRESESGRRRPLLIVALAALPWIVVIALLALPGRLGGVNGPPSPELDSTASAAGIERPSPSNHRSASGDGSDGTTTSGDGVDEEATDGDLRREEEMAPAAKNDEVTEAEAPLLDLVELRGRWRPVPGPEEAAALAVVVARGWLTGVDPVLSLEGVEPELPDGYAEHLVVEAIERPAPEAAVVTLLAVILDGSPELRTHVRRLAVPIAWERDGPRPAGEPWWLPGPNLEPLLPEIETLDDAADQLLAVEALTQAGYEDVELRQLGRSSGWPVIAEIDARTSDGAHVAGSVWLREHQGHLVVAGTALSTRKSSHQPGEGDEKSGGSDEDPDEAAEVEE